MQLFISFIQLKEKEVVSTITVHISASDGTPAVYQGLLGCLQGLPLHTLPVARDAILRLHLRARHCASHQRYWETSISMQPRSDM